MANFNTPYESEREGQMEFFDNYGIPYNDDASVLVDNTDGVYNGNIFEFKLNISNLNKTLFQAVKYLSKMRIKGESVPATILLIDLNATTVYVYKSRDYFAAIHKVYTGAASKDNEGFVAGNYDLMLNYSDMGQSAQVKKIIKGRKVNPDEMYMPVDIDENCIVGWAERYYREKPKASKGDFLGDDSGTAVKVTGEIRDPRHFKGLINPYTGKSNEKFKYLMDCLNDRLSKKDLGAFYTPIPYAKKAAELVQMAVDRVPDGNDYIILDRCVDGNTEYFNGHEWKKISEYQDGEQVLQWNPDGTANLVKPLRYINAPADEEFYHYTSQTLDMCLSASHRVVYKDWKGCLKEKSAKNVYNDWSNQATGFRGTISTAFFFEGKQTYDEDILRVAVMINADGSYQPRRSSVDGANKHLSNHDKVLQNHCIYMVRVHKERKISRARQILESSGLRYTEHSVSDTRKDSYLDGIYFLIEFPYFNPKTFPEDFMYLSEECKRAVLEEVLYWDGCDNADGKAYFSTNKQNIDTIQFMAASINKRTRISTYDRNGKPFYRLSFTDNAKSILYKAGNVQFTTENIGRKYCFSVPSSYLVLRRNNKIFVTGNCAGTGNLEEVLEAVCDKNGDSLISHCVVSTYEYFEWKVLSERIGDKVRDIIPPSEANVVYENGKVANADAMSEDFINNPIIRQYVDNPQCTIILFENPPYSDNTAITFVDDSGTRGQTSRSDSFIRAEYKKHITEFGSAQASANDLANLFIWSGAEYYMRNKSDAYVVFSGASVAWVGK